LKDYLGEASDHAEVLIRARSGERRAEVKKRLAAQRTIFDAMSAEEKADAASKAMDATRFKHGRTTACPSCSNPALLAGDEIRRSEPSYYDGELVVTVTHATSELRCMSCGLHLRTIDECAAAGVAPRFQQYESTSLHEIHQDQEEQEYDNM
jgi:hypothetical protein